MFLTLFEMSAMMMVMVMMMLDVYLMSTWINLAYTTGPVENVCCSRCQKQNLALCSVCSLRFCESTP